MFAIIQPSKIQVTTSNITFAIVQPSKLQVTTLDTATPSGLKKYYNTTEENQASETTFNKTRTTSNITQQATITQIFENKHLIHVFPPTTHYIGKLPLKSIKALLPVLKI